MLLLASAHVSRWILPSLVALAAGCAGGPVRQASAEAGAGLAAGTWIGIGRSVEGRPLVSAEFGDGPRRIYLIAGIHGDERAGGENVDRIHALLAGEADLAGLRVRLLRDANPDGTERRSRHNARGVDLNRNWPARSFRPNRGRGPAPLSEPESAAVHADLIAFDPHLVVVLHAARNGPYVNYDGPAEREARRFARGAASVDPAWHVRADMGYPTPGSLGSLVGIDLGVPILTIEFERGSAPSAAWRTLRAGLLGILGESEPVYRVR